MLQLDQCVGRLEAGTKAERLARLRAAGLPVLDGWVLLPGDPVELPPEGERFIVRSSSNLEDTAAGVFLSVANVGREEIPSAVERVRASAGDEPARLYLRGVAPSMAVLIQPMSKAPKLAVAMSEGGGFLVEERRAGEPEWGDVEARRVESGPLGDLLRKLESLMGGPIDAELALDQAITVLQVRPRQRGPLEKIDAAFASFAEPGRWKLDAEHNPRPLSAAQTRLVELVEKLGVGARQRVVAGYLYVEMGAPRGLTPIPLPDLRRRFDEEVAPDCRRRFADARGIEGAVDAYSHFYKRYVGELAPSISRARAQLDQLLRMNLGEPLAQNGALLGGVGGAALRRDQMLWQLGRGEISLADYLAQFGAWSPAWDVAVPPDDEAHDRVLAAARALTVEPQKQHEAAVAVADAAASALLERLDRMARRAFKALMPTVRTAIEVGEDDDALFFEAQRLVRRALTEGLELPPERITPPPFIEDGQPRFLLPPESQVLRGHATAGRARGRAVLLGGELGSDAILVVPALLPSLAHLLPRCRALVTAHGGATSHGATLAREYGIPAVLGARGAEKITAGTELFVDGAEGRVYLISPPS